MCQQPAYLELEFIPAGSAVVTSRFACLNKPGKPEELIVVDDEGGVYRGGEAWIMCLYALRAYREWSLRLASPVLLPLARTAFHLLSRNRISATSILNLPPDDEILRYIGTFSAVPACASQTKEVKS